MCAEKEEQEADPKVPSTEGLVTGFVQEPARVTTKQWPHTPCGFSETQKTKYIELAEKPSLRAQKLLMFQPLISWQCQHALPLHLVLSGAFKWRSITTRKTALLGQSSFRSYLTVSNNCGNSNRCTSVYYFTFLMRPKYHNILFWQLFPLHNCVSFVLYLANNAYYLFSGKQKTRKRPPPFNTRIFIFRWIKAETLGIKTFLIQCYYIARYIISSSSKGIAK